MSSSSISIRGRWPLALFLPHIASVACSSPSTHEPFEVGGPSDRVAIGTAALIVVSSDRQVSDLEDDSYCGPSPSAVAIDHVSCAPDCKATTSPDGVVVTSGSAGAKAVDIQYHLPYDGTALSRSVTVTFADVTKIRVERAPSGSPSGAKRAMVLGDTQIWTVTVGDGQGPLLADVCAGLISAPGGAISAARSAESCFSPSFAKVDFDVGAEGVGGGSIVFRYGALVRTVQAVVVDPTRAKSATLAAAETSGGGPVDVDEEADPPATPTPLVLGIDCDDSRKAVIPRLMMDDGTVAFGGASLLRTSRPDAISFTLWGQTALTDLRYTTPGAILGTYGAAQLEAPYTVRPTCHLFDQGDDGGAPDRGGDADAGVDASTDGGAP